MSRLGVYRKSKRHWFEIFEAHCGGHTVVARHIKDRRTARIMAEAFNMLDVCRATLVWADRHGLVGISEDIRKILGRINNPENSEDPPEGMQ